MMWLGGLFVLLSLAWVIAHTSGYGADIRVSERPPDHPSKGPPLDGPSLFGTNLEAIPSLVNEEDDLELTIVTASPSSSEMTASALSAKPPSPASAPKPETPSVKVIYEDEAELEEVTLP